MQCERFVITGCRLYYPPFIFAKHTLSGVAHVYGKGEILSKQVYLTMLCETVVSEAEESRGFSRKEANAAGQRILQQRGVKS